jgi:hypothetical protein
MTANRNFENGAKSQYLGTTLSRNVTWKYGAQLWGCSKVININIIQQFQNKVLRGIVHAPWYVRNSNLRRDLNIESLTDVIKKVAQNHEQILHNHPNTEAMQLLNYREATRRLNRTKPLELC